MKMFLIEGGDHAICFSLEEAKQSVERMCGKGGEWLEKIQGTCHSYFGGGLVKIIEVETPLEKLTKAAVSYFELDPSKPSIATSWLGEEKGWYMSVVRYHQRFGEGKEVFVKAMHKEYAVCLQQLAEAFQELRVQLAQMKE
jgi:hypothetical protein